MPTTTPPPTTAQPTNETLVTNSTLEVGPENTTWTGMWNHTLINVTELWNTSIGLDVDNNTGYGFTTEMPVNLEMTESYNVTNITKV